MVGRLAVGVLVFTFICFPGAAGCAADREQDEALPRWELVQELRIGGVHDPEASFSSIVGLTAGPDDRLYVGQWRVSEIWVFDADGRRVGTIGRSGEGPGELSAPGELGWLGDTLWVSDGMARRLNFYDRDGRFLDAVHFSIPNPSARASFAPSAPLADGSVLGMSGFAPDAVLRDGLDRIPVLKVSRSGEVRDTLGHQALRRAVMRISLGAGASFFYMLHPLGTGSHVQVAGDGRSLWVVDPAPGGSPRAFRIVRLGLDGDTLVDRRVSFEPVPVAPGFAEGLAAHSYAVSEYLHGRLPEARYREAYLEAFGSVEHHPPVTGAWPAADGTLWLRREDPREGAVRFQVFDADARPVAELLLPRELDLRDIGEDHLWAVRAEEWEVPFIYRYRIRRP